VCHAPARPQVLHHADGGSRTDKYERDLVLLGQDWDERPGDARTAFYMARTLEALENYEGAIDWYRRRAELGGFEEERWYASFRLGTCLLAAGLVDEGRAHLWQSWATRPWRAERLAELAEHYRAGGKWHDAWRACMSAFASAPVRPEGAKGQVADSLFVDAEVYEWRLAYEASIAAWYVGELPAGRRYGQYVLSCGGAPIIVRQAVRKNAKFYPRNL
jgi:tetratricopeptide (TPR) repeat protein